MKLFELSEEMRNVEMLLEKEPDEETQKMLEETKAEIGKDIEKKAENILALMKNFSADVEALDKEIKRMTNQKRITESKISWLEILLVNHLQTGFKIKSPIGKLEIKESKKVMITDENQIPPEWREIIPESFKVPLTPLKKFLIEGNAVSGAKIDISKTVYYR